MRDFDNNCPQCNGVGETVYPPDEFNFVQCRRCEGSGRYDPRFPQSFESVIRHIISKLDPKYGRDGLVDTPARVTKALKEWTSGYSVHIPSLFTVFEDGAENVDEMILVRDIPFYSLCEHHLAPFFGTATVAYIPNGRIVGLSKINRLVDAFARRLQVQERMTTQIADALVTNLKPTGCGVVVTARHLCMESRGVRQQGHSTTTSALRGAFKDEPTARQEFISLIGG